MVLAIDFCVKEGEKIMPRLKLINNNKTGFICFATKALDEILTTIPELKGPLAIV